MLSASGIDSSFSVSNFVSFMLPKAALYLGVSWNTHIKSRLYYCWLVASSTVIIMVDSLVLPSKSTHMFGCNCVGLIGLDWSLFVCRSLVVKGVVSVDCMCIVKWINQTFHKCLLSEIRVCTHDIACCLSKKSPLRSPGHQGCKCVCSWL